MRYEFNEADVLSRRDFRHSRPVVRSGGMRIWHLIVAVIITATFLTLWRDPVGRVALIVFVTGLGEVFFGLTALLALFRTIGAIGQARRLSAYAEALVATGLVLVVASALMNGLLWIGVWLVQRVVA